MKYCIWPFPQFHCFKKLSITGERIYASTGMGSEVPVTHECFALGLLALVIRYSNSEHPAYTVAGYVFVHLN